MAGRLGLCRRTGPILLLMVLLSGSACSPPPLERYLRLDAVAVPMRATAHPATGALQVLPFTARGLLAERHLLFIDPASGEARPAATLIWEEAPARGTARVVTRILQAAGVAGAVLPPDAPGLAESWLDAGVERFELVVEPDGSRRAVAELAFTLLVGRDRRPALIARYCRAAPSGADPAPAFSRAISAIAAQLASDLAALTTAASPMLIGQGLGREGCVDA